MGVKQVLFFFGGGGVCFSFFFFFVLKLSNSSGEAKGQTTTEILKVAACFGQLLKSTVITSDPENSAGSSLQL